MLEPRQTHKIKFRDRNKLDENLKRYVYPDTAEVYALNFKESEVEISFGVWNMNAKTGKEYIENYSVPRKNVKSILDLKTNTYLISAYSPS